MVQQRREERPGEGLVRSSRRNRQRAAMKRQGRQHTAQQAGGSRPGTSAGCRQPRQQRRRHALMSAPSSADALRASSRGSSCTESMSLSGTCTAGKEGCVG